MLSYSFLSVLWKLSVVGRVSRIRWSRWKTIFGTFWPLSGSTVNYICSMARWKHLPCCNGIFLIFISRWDIPPLYFLFLCPSWWFSLCYVNVNYCHTELSHATLPHKKLNGTWKSKLFCVRVSLYLCSCLRYFTWSLSIIFFLSLSTGFQNGRAKMPPPSPPQSESQILTSPRSPHSGKASIMAEL